MADQLATIAICAGDNKCLGLHKGDIPRSYIRFLCKYQTKKSTGHCTKKKTDQITILGNWSSIATLHPRG